MDTSSSIFFAQLAITCLSKVNNYRRNYLKTKNTWSEQVNFKRTLADISYICTNFRNVRTNFLRNDSRSKTVSITFLFVRVWLNVGHRLVDSIWRRWKNRRQNFRPRLFVTASRLLNTYARCSIGFSKSNSRTHSSSLPSMFVEDERASTSRRDDETISRKLAAKHPRNTWNFSWSLRGRDRFKNEYNTTLLFNSMHTWVSEDLLSRISKI